MNNLKMDFNAKQNAQLMRIETVQRNKGHRAKY
jgi:hypothetical protein